MHRMYAKPQCRIWKSLIFWNTRENMVALGQKQSGLPLRLLQKIFIRKDYHVGYLGCQTHN